MKRTHITPNLESFPKEFHTILSGAEIYDSSCSTEARVIYINKDGGYYLKTAPKGFLEKEALLTQYFHGKNIAAEVLGFFSGEKDWLLTAKVHGEDLTHADYLSRPERLCDVFAESLRTLHSLDFSDCPVKDRTKSYIETVENNYRTGNYDRSAFPDSFGYSSAEQAWKVVCENKRRMKSDVLLHGDYCLPNVIFNNWRFSGFIDLGNGGVGDRHIDLFWGIWTLWFNLKTHKYAKRFIDAYGRDKVDTDMLKTVAAMEVFG